MPRKRNRVKYNNRDENVLLTKHDIMEGWKSCFYSSFNDEYTRIMDFKEF